MAFTLSTTVQKAYELLELSINNGAKPIILIDDPKGVSKKELIDLLFLNRKDTIIIDYNSFLMNEAFSMEKMELLAKYNYVIIENVVHLYGKSATAKILADFVIKMSELETGVIFICSRLDFDMAEFLDYADSYVQYKLMLEDE